MDVKKVYDYNSNILNYRRKEGTEYYLELREKVTIIDGDSSTGKTLLVNDLSNTKKSGASLTGLDLSNVVIVETDTDIGMDSKILYITDRADMFLNDDICDRICGYTKARFLIFARGDYKLGVSPNHFGEFKKKANTISIEYAFNESWW